MMNIKALIATLVLGSSSLAVVAPSIASADVRDHREPVQQPVVIDHRAPAPTPAPAPAYEHRDHDNDRDGWKTRGPVWKTLSTSDQLINGRSVVRLAGAQLTTLKLQATSGNLKISQVMVKFDNGRSQIVYPNQAISTSNPSLTIDLTGGLRQVKSITVLGSGNRRAAFEILGA